MRSDTPEGNVVVQQSLIFAWVVITAQQQIATRIPKRFILSDLNLYSLFSGFSSQLIYHNGDSPISGDVASGAEAIHGDVEGDHQRLQRVVEAQHAL